MENTAALAPWLDALARRLAIAPEDLPEIDTVLQVAGIAAHGVARPAAPLTTYLMGMAASTGREPDELARVITDLVAQWQQDSAPVAAPEDRSTLDS